MLIELEMITKRADLRREAERIRLVALARSHGVSADTALPDRLLAACKQALPLLRRVARGWRQALSIADELERQKAELRRQRGELARHGQQLQRQRDELSRQDREIFRRRAELGRLREELAQQRARARQAG